MVSLRPVRFPLKLKLLVLMIMLIAGSLIFYVGIALKIFQEDKSAYIYETLLNKASTERIILNQKLISQFNLADPAQAAFKIQGERLNFNGQDPTPVLKEVLAQDSIFELKLVFIHPTGFFQWQEGDLKRLSDTEEELFAPILEQSLNQAVREVQLSDKKWLYAYDYDPVANYAFVTSLPHDEAFAVMRYLVSKSTYYGLFVLGVAMLLSVLMARPLTSQLESLFAMTQELAKGNFKQRVTIKGHDEVGALSDSINDMADKILVYMEEMKEKARLENEVAVAQLVQSSFFPSQRHLKDDNFEIYGHFEPATECGGDWWGIFDFGDWRIFFIADATGHGVPAALLTATINCCKTSLGFILETRPEMAGRPDEILRYMNQAVYGSGEKIQVTCFVACLNRRTHELVYSNSSHTPPLLFSGQSAKLEKDDFQPLIGANGPRLGQKSDAHYDMSTIEIKTRDTIVFYTDGIIEAENADGSRWGERRLIKSLIEHGAGSPEQVINGIWQNFSNHVSGQLKNDDLTVVAMKVIA